MFSARLNDNEDYPVTRDYLGVEAMEAELTDLGTSELWKAVNYSVINYLALEFATGR